MAKVHERISNQRSDFAHQKSTKIVNQYGRIFVEDITVNEMNSHRCMNRSIRDMAWSQFFSFLSYLWTPAEDAAVLPDVCLSVL